MSENLTTDSSEVRGSRLGIVWSCVHQGAVAQGQQVDLSFLSKVLTEGRPLGEAEQNKRGLALEDFSNLPGETKGFLKSKEEVKTKDWIRFLLMEVRISPHSTSPLPGRGREHVPHKLQLNNCNNILP